MKCKHAHSNVVYSQDGGKFLYCPMCGAISKSKGGPWTIPPIVRKLESEIRDLSFVLINMVDEQGNVIRE